MKDILKEIFYSAIKAVDPYDAVKRHAGMVRKAYEEGSYEKLLVIGFGKAAPRMALAAQEEFGGLITDGLIVTKYGHAEGVGLRKIEVREAAHPVPDEAGLKAAEEIVALAKAADSRTLALCLVSGGGSALLSLPADGIALSDKMAVTGMLLKAGADIAELNAVRKHISKVKGGRLARMLSPATVLSLIVSDVMGDALDVIASGPTHPDPATFDGALSVLEKYSLTESAPDSVVRFLKEGAGGAHAETPKGGPLFKDVKNIIICGNIDALKAAEACARELGFDARVLEDELTGEASEAGRRLARMAAGAPPGAALIAGGETTVTVRGQGAGGRNMELALAFAIEAEGHKGLYLLSAGTDGTDGTTDAAGAFANGETATRAREAGLEPERYLKENDSYKFFSQAGDTVGPGGSGGPGGLGGLFVTGPTGTNVMDIAIVIQKEAG